MAQRSSILCPNCKKLISSKEPSCPYCGTLRPGSFLKNNAWTRLSADHERITAAIIITNVAIYILSLIINISGVQFSMNPLGFLSPGDAAIINLGATGTMPVAIYGGWLTVITACWLHGSLLHLIFNMMAIKQIIPMVSREYGTHRTILIYLISGMAGYIVSILAGTSYTLGASGALCGLVGSVFYFGKSRGGVYGEAIARQTTGWLLTLLVIGFLPGIDAWAHGGGVAAGIALAWLMGYNERKKEAVGHKLAAGSVSLFTAAVLCRFVLSALI